MINTSRPIRTARLVLLISLCVFWTAGSLFFITEERTAPSAEGKTRTVIGERMNRDELRLDEMAQLRDIISDENTMPDLREQAQNRLMALREWMDCETVIEDVLTVRGYRTVLVTVSARSVNIAVDGSVTADDAAVMIELASRETGIYAENIKIIPIDQ